MWISIRMEQIAVGVALNGGDTVGEAQLLRAGDFAYPTGAAAYAAVTSVRAEQPGLDPVQVAELCAPRLAEHHVSGAALLTYAAMAAGTPAEQIALSCRELLRHGSTHAVSQAHAQLAACRTADGRPEPERLAALGQATATLSEAILRRASMLGWLPEEATEPVDDLWDAWFTRWPTVGAPDGPDAGWREAEKTILAGLIQHPRLLWTVGPWLDAATFSTLAYQDAFDTMMILGEDFAASPDRVKSLGAMLAGADRSFVAEPQKPSPQVRHQELKDLAALAATPVSVTDCVTAAHQLITQDVAGHQPSAGIAPATQALPHVPPPAPLPGNGPAPRP